MRVKDTENIKKEISEKRKKDHKKLRNLTILAFICTAARLSLYFLSPYLDGLLIDALWLPLALLILALPFYGFEWLLDKLRK